MGPAPKIVGVLSCGLLLCLGQSNTAQAEHSPSASDVMKTDSQSDSGLAFQSDDDRGHDLPTFQAMATSLAKQP
jgi:hypothetical protein